MFLCCYTGPVLGQAEVRYGFDHCRAEVRKPRAKCKHRITSIFLFHPLLFSYSSSQPTPFYPFQPLKNTKSFFSLISTLKASTMQVLKFVQVIGLLAIGTTALPAPAGTAIQQQHNKLQPTLRECQKYCSTAPKVLPRGGDQPGVWSFYCNKCKVYVYTRAEVENHRHEKD